LDETRGEKEQGINFIEGKSELVDEVINKTHV